MAHIQQRDFCSRVKNEFPDYFLGTFVLDIGSLDINGNNKFLFENCGYIGVDLQPGKNVDVVSAGGDLAFPDATFDLIISAECFEHDRYYQITLRNIVRMLKPGGLFIFTCATLGRPEHGTRRSTPEDAPFTQIFGEWGDYYKNLEEDDVREAIDIDREFEQYDFSIQNETHDLYFWGIKKGEWERRTDYSFLLSDGCAGEFGRMVTTHKHRIADAERERDEARIAEREAIKRRDEAEAQGARVVAAVERERDEARIAEREAIKRRDEAEAQGAQLVAAIDALRHSRSWRATAPMRMLSTALRCPFVRLSVERPRKSSVRDGGTSRVRALARTIYRRLPLTQSTKWRLRERLGGLLTAIEGRQGLHAVTRELGAALQPRHGATALARDYMDECALSRILLALGEHARAHGAIRQWIALPFLSTGGAERVALNFAGAIDEKAPGESVLILVTDRGLVDPNVDLPPRILVLSIEQYLPGASYDARQTLLRQLILAGQPTCVHIINSEIAWYLLLREGERLRRYTRFFASIFAFQFANDGVTKIGYAANFLKEGLPHLAGLFSDNKRFIDDAASEYRLSAADRAKLHVIYQPVRVFARVNAGTDCEKYSDPRNRMLGAAAAANKRRPQILWAGRLDPEKRIDLFLEIVRRCPFADFRVFGQIVLSDGNTLESLPNLYYEGPFKSPLEWIAHCNFDAMVFTSRWEGMPNVIIEAGALGIPVIAPTVGGIGELVQENTGYPLPERPEATDYKRAIETVMAYPNDAADRALRMRDLIRERHSWQEFVERVVAIPQYVGEPILSSMTMHPEETVAVSVIIPCFNQGAYLSQSVASALAACRSRTEVIIIDDGSTDPALERHLAEVRALAPDVIRIHRQRNQGLAAARNAGVAMARGRYIQLLDADDILIPGKIDVQIAQFDVNPSLDVSVSNFLLCDEGRTEFSKPSEAIATFDLTTEDFLYRWERGFAIPIHCALLRRSVFDDVYFDIQATAKEDWLFWTEIVIKGKRLGYVHGHWAMYRQHAGSMRRSYVKMGRAWLQAGAKIDGMLEGKEPRFIGSVVDWFNKYYRAAPEYAAEINDNRLRECEELALTDQRSDERESDVSLNRKANMILEKLACIERTDMPPLISVVIPVYGHFDYLQNCLESVSRQGDVSIEVICIDDASMDPRVGALMRSLEGKNSRLRVFVEEANRGISAVQNKAVELANGEYIAFLDCDDELVPNALETIARRLDDQPDIDYLFTDRINIDESGKEMGTARYGGYRDIRYSSDESIRHDLLDGMVASHLKVIRRKVYQAVGGCALEYAGVQDWELALRISRQHTLRYLPQSLYRHRIHQRSVTLTDSVWQFRKTNQVRRTFQVEMLRPSGIKNVTTHPPIMLTA